MFKPTDNPSPQEKAAKQYSESLNRHTSLLGAFERALRIIDELYQRLEREMYAGLAYKASSTEPRKPTQGFYNSTHAKDAVNLSRALAQAGAVHARLLENESARAEAMSEEQKVAYMITALRKKPTAVRAQVIEALGGVHRSELP